MGKSVHLLLHVHDRAWPCAVQRAYSSYLLALLHVLSFTFFCCYLLYIIDISAAPSCMFENYPFYRTAAAIMSLDGAVNRHGNGLLIYSAAPRRYYPGKTPRPARMTVTALATLSALNLGHQLLASTNSGQRVLVSGASGFRDFSYGFWCYDFKLPRKRRRMSSARVPHNF